VISIIVSTHNPEFLNKLEKSISDTIGIEYEVIPVVNHAQFSICNAYNQGIAKAKYDYLCFVHEDVIFKSQGWGVEAISVMKNDKDIGLIGVAGSKFKSSLPLGWHVSILQDMRRGCIFQGQNSFESVFDDFSPDNEKQQIEDVVCLDGVILFTKKSIFKECFFDEVLLKGFHGYDIDFSLQVFFSGKRVVVDRRIKIFHFSLGQFGKDKAKAEWSISRKWFGHLPVSTSDLNLSWLKIFKKEIEIYKWYLIPTIKRKIKKVFHRNEQNK
jgi:glycosyltransferase involved in cell wall biosynthesis